MSDSFKVDSELVIYEVEGEEAPLNDRPRVNVKNHWNRRDFVVIEIDGKTFTVLADQLTRAIEIAQKAHRW